MKTQFTSIAMRFNKENWESIKDKIEAAGIGHNVWAINDDQCYLCNNWSSGQEVLEPYISNHSVKHSNFRLVSKVYETWDEATFLKACGIEVDTYTVSKDFILEAHESACSTFQTKIENQFPELFPELEIGRWIKDDSNQKWLMYRDGKNIYGFDTKGFWFYRKNQSYEPISRDRYATDKEVETALIAEAKRRGFNGENSIKWSFNNVNYSFSFPKFSSFEFENNTLFFAKGIVFEDGKWAEIISEPIEVTLEQIAEKFNVNVEQLKIKK